jgi:hypothetical protein
MSGIDPNRTGANTTELMQQAFEDSGYVQKGEGQKLAWHDGLETYEQANEARKNEPQEAAKKVAEKLADIGAEALAKKGAEKVFGKQIVELAERGMKPLSAVTGPATTAVKSMVTAEVAVGGGMIVAGAATIVAAGKTITDGDRMNNHMNTIALDLATTQLLKLDPDFRHSVIKHYEGNVEPDTVMKKFRNPDGSLTAYGREVVPKLQAACDEGCRAGFQVYRSGDLARFLNDHPDIAARRQKDIAFAKGFDQVIFAMTYGDNDHKLVQIKKDVDSRDVRLQSQAAVRG